MEMYTDHSENVTSLPTAQLARVATDQVLQLYSAVSEQDWRTLAQCKDDYDTFFPEPDDEIAITRAKRICAACPVLTNCTSWTQENDEPFGVWAGLSEVERNGKVERDADLEIVLDLAADPILLERALVLLPVNQAGLLAKMVDVEACDKKNGLEPDRYKTAAYALEKAKETDRPYEVEVWRNKIISLADKLLEGGFNYHQWIRDHPNQPPRSALMFLCRAGEPIPDNVPLIDLRVVALNVLQNFPLGQKQQVREAKIQIIENLFGLKNGQPQDFSEVAAEADLTLIQLQSLLAKAFIAYNKSRQSLIED